MVKDRWIKAACAFLCAFLVFGIFSEFKSDVVRADNWDGSYTLDVNTSANTCTFSITYMSFTGGTAYSAWAWTNNDNYTATTSLNGNTLYVTVRGKSGRTFDTNVTVSVGISTSEAEPNCALDRAGFYYYFDESLVPTNTPTPTRRPNTPTPTRRPNTPTPTRRPNTPTPTRRPNTPTPTRRPNTPTPTRRPNTPTPTRRPNTPTPRPATATPRPTNTTRPNTATPIPTMAPATSTPVPTVATVDPAQGEGVWLDPTDTPTATPIPVETEATVEEAIATDTPTATPTEVEEAEENDELPPDGEVIVPGSDEDTGDDIATDDGDGDGTPTPTRRTAVGGIIRKDKVNGEKSGFPWWILILLLILGAAGYRYRQLSKDNYYGMELVCEFIPGGIIGNVVDKVAPNLRKPATPPAPKEDEPVVVNGYLKTSNTKSIRPVYSNAPQTRATRGVTSQAAKTVTPVTTANAGRPATATRPAAATRPATTARPATSSAPKAPVTPKPPVKRPASLSSNRAVADAAKAAAKTPISSDTSVAEAAAKAEAARAEAVKAEAAAAAVSAGIVAAKKEDAKTAPSVNKVPVQQRPPVKRPASMSINRAAAEATAAKAATATPEAVKASAKPSPFADKAASSASKPATQATVAGRPGSTAQRPMVKRPTGAATVASSAASKGQAGVKAAGTPDSYFIPMKNPEKKETINPFKSAPKAEPSTPSTSASRPFNAAAAMKELRAMEAAEAEAPKAPEVKPSTPDDKSGLGGFLGKFKK